MQRSNRIGHKILTYIVYVSFVLSIITTIIQLYSDFNRNEHALMQRLENVESIHIPLLVLSTWEMDEKSIIKQLEGMVLNPDVACLKYTVQLMRSFEAGPLDCLTSSGKIISVKHEDVELGELILHANRQQLIDNLKAQFLVMFSAQIAKAFLSGLFIFFIVYFFVTRHIEKIENFFSVQTLNNLYMPLILHKKNISPDELDNMVNVYNDLRINLVENIEKLNQSDAVISSMKEGVVILDEDFSICRTNPAFEEITLYNESELIGENAFFMLIDQGMRKKLISEIGESISTHGNWQGELLCLRKDGDFYQEQREIGLIPLSGEEGKYFSVVTDITEVNNSRRMIEYQASHDSLTHLLNRRSIYDKIEKLINNPHVEEFVIIYFDLDNFKSINDAEGHGAGDVLLKEVARKLTRYIRSPHHLSRIGGDEFLAVLGEGSDSIYIKKLLMKLHYSFQKAFNVKNKNIYISASIGVAFYPRDGSDADELVAKADQAMYVAKKEGRNQYRYFDESVKGYFNYQLKVKQALSSTFDENEFYVVFQPIIDVTSNLIVKFEALARWESKILGAVSPADFIPIAEEFGLMLRISDIITRKAMTGLKKLKKYYGDDISIAINRSVVELNCPGHESVRLSKLITEVGLRPQCITIEVTESMFLGDNATNAKKELTLLHELGVQIAIDDFGVGYSSLSYLTSYPIDIVKIDKSFVTNIATNKQARLMMKAIISLGKVLDMKIIVEGIENLQQYTLIQRHNADYYQGHFFSEAKRLEDLLTNRIISRNPV